MLEVVANLPTIDAEHAASVIERMGREFSVDPACSPVQGWGMVIVAGARKLDWAFVLAAARNDPTNVVGHWSLTVWLDNASRSQLIDALAAGNNLQQKTAIAHLERMLDDDGDAVPQVAIEALRKLPRAVLLQALGNLLVHYIIWLRNVPQPSAKGAFFKNRFDVLSEELNSLAPASAEAAETIAFARFAEVDVAAFFHGALREPESEVGRVALQGGFERFRAAFAPLKKISADDEYVSLFSYDAYLYFAVRMPLDADAFACLLRGMLADEVSYALEPAAYYRDRARVIILCTIAAIVSKERDDSELAIAVRQEAVLLSNSPTLWQACINEAFAAEVEESTGIVIPAS